MGGQGKFKYEISIFKSDNEGFLGYSDSIASVSGKGLTNKMKEVKYEINRDLFSSFDCEPKFLKMFLWSEMNSSGFDFSTGANDIHRDLDEEKNLLIFSQLVTESHLEAVRKGEFNQKKFDSFLLFLSNQTFLDRNEMNLIEIAKVLRK